MKNSVISCHLKLRINLKPIIRRVIKMRICYLWGLVIMKLYEVFNRHGIHQFFSEGLDMRSNPDERSSSIIFCITTEWPWSNTPCYPTIGERIGIVRIHIPVFLIFIHIIQNLENLITNKTIITIKYNNNIIVPTVFFNPEEHISQSSQMLKIMYNLNPVSQSHICAIQIIIDIVSRLIGWVIIDVYDVVVCVVLSLYWFEEEFVSVFRE